MKILRERIIWRLCVVGLILGHLTYVEGQRGQHDRRGQFQVVSSRRRQVAARAPSSTLSKSRGTDKSRSIDHVGSRSPHSAVKGRQRQVQITRSKTSGVGIMGPLHTNIPGPGFDSFIRDNRAFIRQRGSSGRRAARPSDPRMKIIARNIEVLDRRGQPKALRLTDQRASQTQNTPPRMNQAQRQQLPSRSKLPPAQAMSAQAHLQTLPRQKAPTIPKTRPQASSPVRIRSRLRSKSRSPTGGATTFKSNIRPSPSTSSVAMGNQGTTQKSKISGPDLISVDSLLSLIQDIKGQKTGSGSASGAQRSKPLPTSKAPTRLSAVNPTPASIFSTTPLQSLLNGGAPPSSKIQNGGVMGTGGGNGGKLPGMDPSLALLAQLSMMNPGGDRPDPPTNLFSSLIADPLFMGALNGASGNDVIKAKAMPKPVQLLAKGRPKMSKKDIARQKEIDAMTLLSSKINTGNALQDQMIRSMLQTSIRNLQEDMPEKKDPKEKKRRKEGERLIIV